VKIIERIEWSHEFTCKGCGSKLAAEKDDVEVGSYGSFDEYETVYWVECAVCKTRYDWRGRAQDALPPAVKDAAGERKAERDKPRKS